MYPLRFPAAERRYLSSTPRKAFATSRRSVVPSGDNVIPHRTTSFHKPWKRTTSFHTYNRCRRGMKSYTEQRAASDFLRRSFAFYLLNKDTVSCPDILQEEYRCGLIAPIWSDLAFETTFRTLIDSYCENW